MNGPAMMTSSEAEEVPMSCRSVGRATVVVAMVAGALSVAQGAADASTTVNCASKSLQTAINAAATGSTLLIKGTCSGSFTVAKNLTLKGSPTATLDGNDLGSVLTITGTPTVHLTDLKITGGLAAHGGGINMAGGSLTLSKVTVTDNLAFDAASAQGGGIYASTGSLLITSSSIVANRVLAVATGSGDAGADGGGIYATAKLIVTGSTIDSNRITAKGPAHDAFAFGGGIDASGASVTITGSHLDDNRLVATGTLGASEGGGCECDPKVLSVSHSTMSGNIVRGTATSFQAGAVGGGLDSVVTNGNVTDSVLADNEAFSDTTGGASSSADGAGLVEFATAFAVTGSQITHNTTVARGGTGQTFAEGGAVFCRGVLTFTTTEITHNTAAAQGAGSAGVTGGGVEAESNIGPPSELSLHRSTVADNTARATSTGGFADIEGVGIDASVPLSVVASTISGNTGRATGGAADGGQVVGGGIDATWDNMGSKPSDRVTNSTIANNFAAATESGGTARVEGGGVWVSGVSLKLTDATIAHNSVTGAGSTTTIQGGGVFVDINSAATVAATVLALNTAPTSASGPDCFGKLSSAGHNLLRAKAGCTFAKKPSDKISVSPDLGALAANGGPTDTMALKPGSPAINAIAKSACLVTTDQRGVHRPQSNRCDIGAYERTVPKPKKGKNK
jgi:hypothetical protein